MKLKEEVYIDVLKELDIDPDRVNLFYSGNNVYTVQFKSARVIEDRFSSSTPPLFYNELISILRRLKMIDNVADYDFYQKEIERKEKAFLEYDEKQVRREKDLYETQGLIHQWYEAQLQKDTKK